MSWTGFLSLGWVRHILGTVRRLACLEWRFGLRSSRRCCWEHMAEALSDKVRNVVVDCIYLLFLKCHLGIAPIGWWCLYSLPLNLDRALWLPPSLEYGRIHQMNPEARSLKCHTLPFLSFGTVSLSTQSPCSEEAPNSLGWEITQRVHVSVFWQLPGWRPHWGPASVTRPIGDDNFSYFQSPAVESLLVFVSSQIRPQIWWSRNKPSLLSLV